MHIGFSLSICPSVCSTAVDMILSAHVLRSVFLFLFLFFWSLLSHSRIFHSYGDVTIAGEGLQILTYARHSWPLSSEGSLKCHTYCDTSLPFIRVISEDAWHSHLLSSVWQWSCHYLFLRLRSVTTGDRTPSTRMRGERSTSTQPRRFLRNGSMDFYYHSQKIINICT